MTTANPALAHAFAALQARRDELLATPLRERFAADPARFARLSLTVGSLLLDYSKNHIDDEALRLLVALARLAGVEARREAMFSGAAINLTENRPALHVALRAPVDAVITVNGRNVIPDVQATLRRMGAFAEGVRSGRIADAHGPFTDVVNIGIGGSDLGPEMTVKALAPVHDGPRIHFVSNVDGAHLRDTVAQLNPARTLVLVASKTFATIETMTNASSARAWIAAALGEARVGAHFAAITTATSMASAFGIPAERTFGFADWVGGRYSIWSAIGLPLMIAIGQEGFRAVLAGGRAMDEHFQSAPLEVNMPVILGLLSVLNRDVIGCAAQAVIPYDQRLARLPAYLQQLVMESNGKGVTITGEPVSHPTAPVVFGEPGTNAQHAFFQMLHQGTDVVPVDFLVAALSDASDADSERHHMLLLANCFAQSEALMRGRTAAEVRQAMAAERRPDADIERLAVHRATPGNRPSNTLLYRRLDPEMLGMIVALYEHRTFVEGVIWEIDSFDQWGVELGKEMASSLLPMIQETSAAGGHDASTTGLIAAARRLRR